MKAIIFQPPKNAMQSGKANTKEWVVKLSPGTHETVDPLMGWTSTDDTLQQVTLKFDTYEQALHYVTTHNYTYELLETDKTSFKPKSYADNFRNNRKQAWTH